MEKFFKALFQLGYAPAASSGAEDDGQGQPFRKQLRVDFDACTLRFVNEVDGNDNIACQLRYPLKQHEAALQAVCVEHGYDGVGFAAFEKIPCDSFLVRAGHERIAAGQVDELYSFAAGQVKIPHCCLDGLPRPVAGMLFKPRERIEDCGFADVGTACKGNGVIVFAVFLLFHSRFTRFS